MDKSTLLLAVPAIITAGFGFAIFVWQPILRRRRALEKATPEQRALLLVLESTSIKLQRKLWDWSRGMCTNLEVNPARAAFNEALRRCYAAGIEEADIAPFSAGLRSQILATSASFP